MEHKVNIGNIKGWARVVVRIYGTMIVLMGMVVCSKLGGMSLRILGNILVEFLMGVVFINGFGGWSLNSQ